MDGPRGHSAVHREIPRTGFKRRKGWRVMDTLTRAQRSERMRRVKSRDTAPELKLRRLVWALGHRYRKNHSSVMGRPDLAFVGRKKAIFIHGCFWHRHGCPSGRRTPKS